MRRKQLDARWTVRCRSAFTSNTQATAGAVRENQIGSITAGWVIGGYRRYRNIVLDLHRVNREYTSFKPEPAGRGAAAGTHSSQSESSENSGGESARR